MNSEKRFLDDDKKFKYQSPKKIVRTHVAIIQFRMDQDEFRARKTLQTKARIFEATDARIISEAYSTYR